MNIHAYGYHCDSKPAGPGRHRPQRSLCASLGVFFVGFLGLGGEVLLAPDVHRVGLVLALVVGVISLGFGVVRHGRIAPLVIGAVGLALMAGAIAVGHGLAESVLTIIGVALVALAHIRNLHRAH